MNSLQIREKFLNFFKKNDHTIVPSSSLIPAQDPTLLFTNAGMNQFKDVFLGKEKRTYKKATSIQKCVRAGGKHNDLDQVGFTNKHLTFFEMVGNFSFGDYFKEEAIKYAWEFLTKEMNLPEEKLVVSVFKTDDESYEIWNKKIGIPPEKIYRLGEKENFWQMGDIGPCGPCTEIHMDFGKDPNCKNKNCDPSCNCKRFVEIWNLVFMQYNKQEDGELKPLKQKGVDTGMGFERLCMVVQNKTSLFEIDIFQDLIKKIEKLTKKSYSKSENKIKSAFNVLADHVRASSLLISDGCMPSNEGRGYVLRKIIRRAALFAKKLSDNKKLFPALSTEFIKIMGPIYPELKTNEELIFKILTSEIERFSENLIQGQNILEKYIKESLDNKLKKILTGKQAFKLYDTYGFPLELTILMAKEQGFDVDTNGFEIEMKKQQKQSGKKLKKEEENKLEKEISANIKTQFTGYDELENKSKIIFTLPDEKDLWVITKQTPFYVESGGQVSDSGWITINERTYPIIQFYKNNNAIAVKIKKETTDKIKIGDIAHSIVDYYTRINTMKNHTATHMLQAALIQIVGKQIKQAGSFVNDKILRFDITHHEALTKEQIEQIEKLVNDKIQENIEVKIFNTTLEKAKEAGAMAFFGEKYNPENVRVIQIPGFSTELCGGTHVKRTGDIGSFKLLSDIALASGIRRLTGITGPESIRIFQENFDTNKKLSEKFKVKQQDIIEAVEKQQENFESALKEIKQLKKQLLTTQIPQWTRQIEQINELPFLFLEIPDLNNVELKQIATEIEKTKPAFFFLISGIDKINFVGYLSKNFENKINLKNFANFLKEELKLKGGGNKTLIQGGGEKTKNIKEQIIKWIKNIK